MLLKVIIINDLLAQIVHILLQILVQFDETSIGGALHRSLQVSVKDAAVPLFAIQDGEAGLAGHPTGGMV